jgi:PAS domain S-box-containing protein
MRRFEALKHGAVASYRIEKRYLHKSGKTIWVNLTAALARDLSGAPNYVIAALEDITPRKQFAEQLSSI